MNKKSRVACIATILLLAFSLSSCGTPEEQVDYPLKQAFVNAKAAQSFHFDASLTFKLDEKQFDKNKVNNQIFYEYFENSYIRISGDINFNDKLKNDGIISWNIDWYYGRMDLVNGNGRVDLRPQKFSAHIDTSFDFKDINRETKPEMIISSAINFVQQQRIQMPIWFIDEARVYGVEKSEHDLKKYFSSDLSKNALVFNYFRNYFNKEVPYFQELAQTLTWSFAGHPDGKDTKNDSIYKVTLSNEEVKTYINNLISSLDTVFDSTTNFRIASAIDAMNFNVNSLEYTINPELQFTKQVISSHITLDYKKASNEVIGVPYGRDVSIPVIATLEINYSNWDKVDTLYSPKLSTENSLSIETLPYRQFLPQLKMPSVILPPVEENYAVIVNGKKVQFLANQPPYMYNGVLLLPVTYFMETQEITVNTTTQNDKMVVDGVIGTRPFTVTMDKDVAFIANREIPLSGNAGYIYGTLYAPIDFFAEAFRWDATIGVVIGESGRNQTQIEFKSRQ